MASACALGRPSDLRRALLVWVTVTSVRLRGLLCASWGMYSRTPRPGALLFLISLGL